MSFHKPCLPEAANAEWQGHIVAGPPRCRRSASLHALVSIRATEGQRELQPHCAYLCPTKSAVVLPPLFITVMAPAYMLS